MVAFLSSAQVAYHAASVDVLAQIGNEAPQPIPGVEKFGLLMSWLKYGGIFLAVCGLIVGGIMLAMERNGTRDGDGKARIVGAMIGSVVIGLAPAVINQLSS
ncbi:MULTISPECIES: hypothetical protein [Nocardiaceae]|uniref:hypothetical protein n=1 Tax=Nocardiaceae TaxID=85025 RepID=UPI000E01D8D5|nr:hypothetical protein [Rhodococcus erythropolis]SUH12283.1 Uncharacterised protein [Rhodococcus erythropolis]